MDGPVTPRQAKFLDRLQAAKERLLHAVAGLEESVLTTEQVIGEWTVKDIFGHIVTWNEEFRANIEMIINDQHPGLDHQISGEDDFEHWNRQRIKQKEGWSLDRILADFEGDIHAAAQLILRLRPEDFSKRGITPWKNVTAAPSQPITKENTDSVETLVTFHWRHMNQHSGDIEKWRKKVQK